MKHEIRVIPKEEILSNRCSAYSFVDFNNLGPETEVRSVFNYFRKDFTEMYPTEGAEKTLVRPTDVYSKKTLELNKRLGIHKINKQNKKRWQ
jgi:hypothetical protein